MKEEHEAEIAQTVIISVTIIICLFLITSCSSELIIQNQETQRTKTPSERCFENCYTNTCRQKCLELGEKQNSVYEYKIKYYSNNESNQTKTEVKK